MVTGEGSVRIVNFINGCDYVSHYSKYALSSALSVCITLIAVVLRKLVLLSYATVDFRLFYDGAACVRVCPFWLGVGV